MKRVGDIVRGRGLLYVSDRVTALEAARFMTENKIGAVPVLKGDRLVGVFSERDLMTRVLVAGRAADKTSIRDVMTQDLVVADAGDSHAEGIAKMAARGCRHLPVVSEGRLLGFLSLRDLLQVDLDEKTDELELMKEYVQYVPPHLDRGAH